MLEMHIPGKCGALGKQYNTVLRGGVLMLMMMVVMMLMLMLLMMTI